MEGRGKTGDIKVTCFCGNEITIGKKKRKRRAKGSPNATVLTCHIPMEAACSKCKKMVGIIPTEYEENGFLIDFLFRY